MFMFFASIRLAMKIKLFVAREIFSFNSYVYYLTFIASTRAFNLLTRAFNLPIRVFNLQTRAFNFATRAFSLLTCGFELVTREFELVTRGFELVTRGFELVTRGFELVTRGFELVTRNSCFTFPLCSMFKSFDLPISVLTASNMKIKHCHNQKKRKNQPISCLQSQETAYQKHYQNI